MTIEKINREQMAAIYTAWRVLSDPHAVHENPAAFDAGRRWAIEHSFDEVHAVIEFFAWNLAVHAPALAGIWRDDDAIDYFGDAMTTEIGEDEFKRIEAMGVEYRSTWVEGVADAFVLMGGTVIMQEWSPDNVTKH